MAETGGCQTAAQAVISGFDARYDDTRFVNQLILGDTLGAAGPREDGWLGMITAGTAGMSFYDSVEVDELHYPIRIEERRLVPDTEGAGEFRGAPSSRVSFTPTHSPIRVLLPKRRWQSTPLRGREGASREPPLETSRSGAPTESASSSAPGRIWSSKRGNESLESPVAEAATVRLTAATYAGSEPT